MRLVLQCAMCGTVNPVGAPACSTCRASGVPQLRLMFECPACHGLGLTPTCGACPPFVVVDEPEEELAFAEEVVEEPLALDAEDAFEGVLDFDADEEEAFDVDLDLDEEEDEDADLTEDEQQERKEGDD